jgi:DNA polymerase
MVDPLEELNYLIDKCTVCSTFVVPLRKPPPGMKRGVGRDIFIVGQAPGKTEVEKARAFSGGSGTRLDNWLVECGRPRANPRSGVYLTSVLKCPLNTKSDFKEMARRCRHFLDSQLEIIKPKLVITLGAESFEYLKIERGSYDSLIGKIQFPNQNLLVPAQPFSAIVHWPLQASFQEIRAYLED